MGSAGGRLEGEILARAREVGREIARRGWILITGACPGLPHAAVLGAKEERGMTIGISPALNFEEHALRYKSPYRGYDAIIYTGSGLMGREIENIRSCDFVIFLGGRSGTLGELAIAYDEAKVIGVLRGTGGIADHIEEIIGFIRKKTGAHVVIESEPKALLDRLHAIYRDTLLPFYRTVAANRNPDGIPEP
ncbi:MAG: LOG family protein [Acidobacteria bacterium]|nr:LOG family protein [Acidobacteriota bacterium]